MRISAFFVPFFTILAGVGGFYLRISERLHVFDHVTGLPERNAATTIWLYILTAAFILSVIVFAIRVVSRHKALPGFESAFGTDPFAYPIVFVLIGIVWLIGTFLYYSDINTHGFFTSYDIYFLVLSALSAIAVAFFAIEMYKDSRRQAPYALCVIPTAFMCFWLIFLYRHNASNPVLLSYVYQLFAVITTALSFYFTAGFLYGKPAPGRSTVAYFVSIYFCIVTLADDHPLGIIIIICALIAVNLIHGAMLLKNLQRK